MQRFCSLMIRGHNITPDQFRTKGVSSPNNMRVKNCMKEAQDIINGVLYGIWFSRYHLIHSFVITPVGILILLSILYGFNVLLTDIAQVKFPSSVLCMLINLLVLIMLSIISNLNGTDSRSNRSWKSEVGRSASWVLEHYLMIIRPPMNFSLKWINVCFIPAFIMLPLSDSITFVEAMKIGAVFIIGGIVLMVADVYMILGLKRVLTFFDIFTFESDKANPEDGTNHQRSSYKAPDEMELIEINQSYIMPRSDITTIDLSSIRPVQTEPEHVTRNHLLSDNPFSDENEAGSNLQNVVSAPLQIIPRVSLRSTGIEDLEDATLEDDVNDINIQQHARSQMNKLSETAKPVAVFITNYIDWFLYVALLIVGLPFYYISAIHVMLPFHLALTVISYYNALLFLDRFPVARKFAHPILVSTAEILFVCFISSLIYHRGSPKGFLEDLKYYKTGKNYLNLFNGKDLYNSGEIVPATRKGFTSQPMWPGCGDFLSSLMDVSIVSLSLPMFTHRKDFLRNFWLLIPPLTISAAMTFFCYPIICYKIGISSERSLGFVGRSVTLALGTPLIDSLGGSVSLTAVCTILSGICGVLIGDSFFKLLKIPTNDFVIRGVTLGINCGAIATAHLLNSDPRAASMSSLSFSLFGTIMIILASIGVVRDLIRSWVGL